VLGPADLSRDDLDLDDVLQRVPRRPAKAGGRGADAVAGPELGPRRGTVLWRAPPLPGHLSHGFQRQDREGGQSLEDARLARKAVQGADLGADLLRRVPVRRYR